MVSAAAWSSTRARLLVCTRVHAFRARPPTQCRGRPSGVGSGGFRPPSGPRLGPSPRTTRTQARRRGRARGADGRPRPRPGGTGRRPRGAYARTARGTCSTRGTRRPPPTRWSRPGPSNPMPSRALCGRQMPERGSSHPKGRPERDERAGDGHTDPLVGVMTGDGPGSAVPSGRMPGDAAEAALTSARPRSPDTLADGAENSMNSRLFRYT